MMNTAKFNVGDQVSFIGKGRKIVSVISSFKTKQIRGPRNSSVAMQIAMGRLPKLPTLSTEFAIIPDDKTGAVWTVPLHMLTFVGKATTDQLKAASSTVNTLYSNKRANHVKRMVNRADAISANELHSMRIGDPCIVKFSNGPTECEFLGITASARVKVRSSRTGWEGSVPPKFVTPKT